MRLVNIGKLGALTAAVLGGLSAAAFVTGHSGATYVPLMIGLSTAAALWACAMLARVGALLVRMEKSTGPVELPPGVRMDELHAINRVLASLRDDLAARRLLDEQIEAGRRTMDERAKRLESLMRNFEGTVGQLTQAMSSAADGMTGTAQSMFAAADHSDQLSKKVATASAHASQNVNMVAAANEELTVSIQGIAHQVVHSARIAGSAVDEAARTDTVVNGLSGSARKIGQVLTIIQSLARQTNLLALNATIEAARGGEAGKGFAVVANEVKVLATQTTNAAEEIGTHVAEIQSATEDAVQAIRNIAATVSDIGDTTAAIAAAVTQQESAVKEITRSVQEAANGTEQVSHAIVGVTEAAGDTSKAADRVLGIANNVSGRAQDLGGEVNKFLAEVSLQLALWKRKTVNVRAARRLGAEAGGPATALVNRTGLSVTDTTVKVGILHSETGTMALAEAGSIQAELLAIKHINEKGGVLGREIEVVQEDGASDPPVFAEKALKLLAKDMVAVVFGCCTSTSRKALLPVLERHNGMLYYPSFYEGMERSKHVIYLGQEATQQIIVGLDWLMKEKKARSFFLVGSDYIWPRTSNRIARCHIEKSGCRVVGEEYAELGHTQFQSVIARIKAAKPDVIYVLIAGGSNVAFYKQIKAAGIDLGTQLLMTNSVSEEETLGIGGDNIAGAYACMKYFQSLDLPNNGSFVASFKEMWGDDSVVGDMAQNAYIGPWLWKLAVEKAGCFDVERVAVASAGVEFKDAPAGYVRIHENHHLWSKTRIGRARLDGQFDAIFETRDLIEPNPFPDGFKDAAA